MAEGYSPNEKNLKMFGTQESGYTKERVDSYLFQLEGAYVKIKERLNEMESAAPAAAPAGDAEAAARIAEVEENNRKLREAAETIRTANTFLRDKVEELTAQLEAANAALAERPMQIVPVPAPAPPAQPESADRDLIAKTLLDARAAAEEILRSARVEAETIGKEVQRRNEALKGEYAHARNQLQSMNYAIVNLLREHDETGTDA